MRFARHSASALKFKTVIFHRYSQNLPLDSVPDVVLDWEATIRGEGAVVLFAEAVRPVCAPEYAATPDFDG